MSTSNERNFEELEIEEPGIPKSSRNLLEKCLQRKFQWIFVTLQLMTMIALMICVLRMGGSVSIKTAPLEPLPPEYIRLDTPETDSPVDENVLSSPLVGSLEKPIEVENSQLNEDTEMATFERIEETLVTAPATTTTTITTTSTSTTTTTSTTEEPTEETTATEKPTEETTTEEPTEDTTTTKEPTEETTTEEPTEETTTEEPTEETTTEEPTEETTTEEPTEETTTEEPTEETTTEEPVEETEATSKPEPDDSICPESYLFFGTTQYCYKLVTVPASLRQAFEICRNEGGNLLSIHSEIEHNFAIGLYHTGMTRNWRIENSMWIPIFKHEMQWKWPDGSVVDYTAWLSPEAAHTSLNARAIVGMSGWKWYGTLGFSDYTYICKHAAKKRNNVNPLDFRYRCPDGYTWFEYTRRCYKAYASQRVSYDDATAHCNSEGADVVSVNSEVENLLLVGFFLKSQVENPGRVSTIWLGVTEKYGRHRWSDYSLVKYTNWENDLEPADRADKTQMSIFGGKWFSSDSPAGFICKNY